MAKPRRLRSPPDGVALFHEATAIPGLTRGWERVWANAGAAGGDGMGIVAFSVGASERIAALSVALRDGSYRKHTEVLRERLADVANT